MTGGYAVTEYTCGRAWAGVAQAVLQQVDGCLQELQQLSPKFLIVRQLVRYCDSLGEKLVIFSENINTLDALQEMLQVVQPCVPGWPCCFPLASHKLSRLCHGCKTNTAPCHCTLLLLQAGAML